LKRVTKCRFLLLGKVAKTPSAVKEWIGILLDNKKPNETINVKRSDEPSGLTDRERLAQVRCRSTVWRGVTKRERERQKREAKE
jgi:hypothetical protein